MIRKCDLYLATYIVVFALIGLSYIENPEAGSGGYIVLSAVLLSPLFLWFIYVKIAGIIIWERFLPREMGIPDEQLDAYVQFLKSGTVGVFSKASDVRDGFQHFLSDAASANEQIQQSKA